MIPGTRTTDHWRVGLAHVVVDPADGLSGVCVSVTPWGNDRVRWVRLRLPDNTERSYSPAQLAVAPGQHVPDDVRTTTPTCPYCGEPVAHHSYLTPTTCVLSSTLANDPDAHASVRNDDVTCH